MAAMPLSFTVENAVSKRSWRRTVLSFFSSLLIQALGLAAVAVLPILSMSALPEPAGRLRLPDYVPVVPVARPEAHSTKRPPSTDTKRRPGPHRAFTTPRFTPFGISDELHDTDWLLESSSGVPRGALQGIPASGVGAPPPPRAEEPKGPIVVGGVVQPPRKRHHVPPHYPPTAIAARIEGEVVLEAIIDPEGNVVNLRVLQSIPLLDGAAIDAVRQWKYEPTRLNGKPVPVLMSVTVTFRLKR